MAVIIQKLLSVTPAYAIKHLSCRCSRRLNTGIIRLSSASTDSKINLTDVDVGQLSNTHNLTNEGKAFSFDRKTHVETKENDPTFHTEKHVGKFYTLDQKDVDTALFDALPRRFMKFSKLVTSYDILIREPAIEIINALRNRPIDGPPLRFIISGKTGLGKTMTLAHVLHYCYRSNWFLLHIPSVFKWISEVCELKQSVSQEGNWDQIKLAYDWLKLCKSVNKHLINKVSLQQSYQLGRNSQADSGDSIASVIEKGLLQSDLVIDVLAVVVKEIVNQSQVPVLYAADEYNGFFGSTRLKDWNGDFIPIKHLSLVNIFSRILKHPEHSLQNGAYVMALSQTGKPRDRSDSADLSNSNDDMAATGLYDNLEVTLLTKEEIETYLEFYKAKSWLRSNPLELEEIYSLTSGSPDVLSKICARI